MFLMPWARFAASHDGGDSMRYCNYEALTDEEIVLDAKDNDNEDALVFLIK